MNNTMIECLFFKNFARYQAFSEKLEFFGKHGPTALFCPSQQLAFNIIFRPSHYNGICLLSPCKKSYSNTTFTQWHSLKLICEMLGHSESCQSLSCWLTPYETTQSVIRDPNNYEQCGCP
ncbi:hypothetical protein VP01_1957g2 [Puccinia sorghi]|uniref:Uncharacterized protein n=1 Tax=Puccinia sorghi TaxID=27349 RepID=A0A0L6VC39_9BASI|nr:hypothetical protein VP01_1957g2 [Puccinia sorghi]